MNDVPDNQPALEKLPLDWLKAIVVLINLIFWTTLLLHMRYGMRLTRLITIVTLIPLLSMGLLTLIRALHQTEHGVVIVDTLDARKGPGVAYALAFNESLHDGLEFVIKEQREGWLLIQLSDSRIAWVTESGVQAID